MKIYVSKYDRSNDVNSQHLRINDFTLIDLKKLAAAASKSEQHNQQYSGNLKDKPGLSCAKLSNSMVSLLVSFIQFKIT